MRETRIDVRPWDDNLIAVGAAGIVLAAPLAAPWQRGRGLVADRTNHGPVPG